MSGEFSNADVIRHAVESLPRARSRQSEHSTLGSRLPVSGFRNERAPGSADVWFGYGSPSDVAFGDK